MTHRTKLQQQQMVPPTLPPLPQDAAAHDRTPSHAESEMPGQDSTPASYAARSGGRCGCTSADVLVEEAVHVVERLSIHGPDDEDDEHAELMEGIEGEETSPVVYTVEEGGSKDTDERIDESRDDDIIFNLMCGEEFDKVYYRPMNSLTKEPRPLDNNGIPGPSNIKNRARWKLEGGRVNMPNAQKLYKGHSGPDLREEVREPIDAMNIFVHKERIIRKFLVIETNKRAHLELSRGPGNYAVTLEGWHDVTVEEMEKFILALELMALIRVPCQRDYWSSGVLGVDTIQALLNQSRFEQIKHCLSVGNPTEEENNADRLANTRAFLNEVRNISQEQYTVGVDIGLDESQVLCGHPNSRVSHRGKTSKPMSDYVKVIAAHESKSGYCNGFLVDERNDSVANMTMAVMRQVSDHGRGEDWQGARRFACDRFYTTVDNIARAWYEERALMYGTIRGDRGPQHSGIPSRMKLRDGEYVWRQADKPLPLTLYKWHDSDANGSWFISSCHGPEADQVIRRRRGHETHLKQCPVCAKEYNEDIGACNQCNALRASCTLQRTHRQRWYMCLVYYGLDILLINSFIFFIARTGSKISQKQYRLSCINHRLARYGIRTVRLINTPSPMRRTRIVGKRGAGRQSRSAEDVFAEKFPERLNRNFGGGHMPEISEVKSQQRLNCKLCYFLTRKEVKTRFFCPDCGVYLCCSSERNCYKQFHSCKQLSTLSSG